MRECIHAWSFDGPPLLPCQVAHLDVDGGVDEIKGAAQAEDDLACGGRGARGSLGFGDPGNAELAASLAARPETTLHRRHTLPAPGKAPRRTVGAEHGGHKGAAGAQQLAPHCLAHRPLLLGQQRHQVAVLIKDLRSTGWVTGAVAFYLTLASAAVRFHGFHVFFCQAAAERAAWGWAKKQL